MAKLFYTISETAELLDEKVTTVRFWSNCFATHLKLGRNGHNNRRYAPSDIETLREIKRLVRECGLSLEAVSKKLSAKEDGSDNTLRVREILLKLRSSLQQICDSL